PLRVVAGRRLAEERLVDLLRGGAIAGLLERTRAPILGVGGLAGVGLGSGVLEGGGCVAVAALLIANPADAPARLAPLRGRRVAVGKPLVGQDGVSRAALPSRHARQRRSHLGLLGVAGAAGDERG